MAVDIGKNGVPKGSVVGPISDRPGAVDYILIKDNDGHWYVIPADKELHFNGWLELSIDDKAYYEVPDYALEVGGSPSLVKFTDFKIE